MLGKEYTVKTFTELSSEELAINTIAQLKEGESKYGRD